MASLLAILPSCEPSSLEANLPDSSVYLLGVDSTGIANVVFYRSQTEAQLKVHAYAGGYHAASGSLSVVADDEMLLDFNEKNGTKFAFLPEECYVIPTDEAKVSPDQRSATFVCQIDCEAVRALGDFDNYLLPLRLVSEDLPLNPKKNFICYRFSEETINIILGNTGMTEVSISSDTDGEVKSVPLTVMTDGAAAPFDNKYKFYCMNITEHSAAVDYLKATMDGRWNLLSEDAYSITSEYVLKEGQTESVSTLNFYVDKIPTGVSYMAIALDNADLTPNNLLTKARVIRVMKDAGYISRDGFTVPYCNIMFGGTDGRGTQNLLDGDLGTIWEAPYNPNLPFCAIDTYFDKWDGCEWLFTAKDGSRVPMICILDMAKTRDLYAVKVSRRKISNKNFKYTKTGEVWVSNDTSGDAALANSIGKNVVNSINFTEDESKAWNTKAFTKVADFDFEAVNNNENQDITVYFDPVQARYVKVVLTAVDPTASKATVLSLSEIEVMGK